MSGAVNPVVKTSDLPLRAASGVVMIAVAVGALVYGGIAFWALLLAAAMLIAAEWAGLMRAGTKRIALTVAGAAVPIVMMKPGFGFQLTTVAWTAAGCGLLVALGGRSLRLGLGVVYAALPTVALMLIRGQNAGIVLAFWTLAIVWATDIGAYFSGRAIGGPRLAPLLSPNKTWAGLLGGMVAALAVSGLLAMLAAVPWRLAGLAGLLAVAAQAGDLFESWLKRRAGVKDSGRLLPGHGGAMDRLDGVVPVACIVGLLVAAGWA